MERLQVRGIPKGNAFSILAAIGEWRIRMLGGKRWLAHRRLATSQSAR